MLGANRRLWCLHWAVACVLPSAAWPSVGRAADVSPPAPAASLSAALDGAAAPAAVTGASPAADPASQPRQEIVALVLRGDALPARELEAALSSELGCTVVAAGELGARVARGTLTLTYRKGASELALSWDSGVHTLTRVVAAPADDERLLGEAVLLAGNLVREQVPGAPAPPAPVPVSPAPTPEPPRLPPPEPERMRITAGLCYPLATNFGKPEVTSNLDFNLLCGRVGGLDGLELGLVNVITRKGRPAELQGLQAGLLLNVVTGSAQGLQVASLANVARSEVAGAQVALGANFAGADLDGLQGALLFNRAGNVRGVQLSLFNYAGDVDGVQLGLINVAAKVRGASIGLLNIADDIDGLPLAPVSVTASGGVHALAWSGSRGLANGGVKFATRHTYSMFFGSYHRAYEQDFVGGGLAFGGRIDLGADLHTDIDLSGTYLVAPELTTEGAHEYYQQLVQPRLRLVFAYRAVPHFGLFLGGAVVGQARARRGWDLVDFSIGPEIFGGIEL